MIPPQLPHNCRSPGERILFSRFRDDPKTVDWIVLHSLGVAKHPKRLGGEIDFVVIVPSEGVLCLEVKGGSVARKGGVWFYGSGTFTETSVVGPFRQAAEAMHAIREYATRQDPSLKGIVFFSGVLFTYVCFDTISGEWHPWQYADRCVLTRCPISEVCLDILGKAHRYIRKTPSAKWYDPLRSRPNREQVNSLINILRGDFEYFVSPRIVVKETEREISRFTAEQFSALDVLAENDRIMYKGPAGTGKTFLAIEAARRSLAQNKRTLLICYNRLLGQWLASQTKSLAEQYWGLLTAGTLHRFLLQLSGLRPSGENESGLWSKKVPEAVIERVLTGVVNTPYCDTLIVDEAQDLVTEESLDVLDLLLNGGLAGGRWVMFGDFERQAIYNPHELNGVLNALGLIKHRSPVHFVYPLRVNCRNTEPIAMGVQLLSRLHPAYSRVLNVGRGVDIDVDFYTSPEEQTSLLRSRIKALLEYFLPSQIVILSTRGDRASCAGALYHVKTRFKLQPLRNERIRNDDTVGFATIHAFKGMESPPIILTDLVEIDSYRAETLLYVGISRARLKLVMLMHENSRATYLDLVRKGFESRMEKEAD